MITKDSETYLGFDLSTQKLKAVQVNVNLEVLAHAEVKFDTDLPEFRTIGGVNSGKIENEYYVQPVMWVKAVDIVLDRLVVQGAEFSTVAAISGSAQQHGSVYWSAQGIQILENLDADKFLHTQIDSTAFTVQHTPIWMDGTTEKQCIEMEEAIGGRDKMVECTGSKSYARFTGPQIRKIYQDRSQIYENTKRISLISSFLASIFLGRVAPIDLSDGSGMNLLDIKSKNWSEICLNACAPDLEEKLGKPVSTCSIIGEIGQFFQQRYSFDASCKVAAFTGDNPSALSGMLLTKDWLAISLGTSDTIMMGIEEPTKLDEGHILVHPTDNTFMGLLCFRNGSLVRDIFKRSDSNDNWEFFSELLDSTPRGNFGNMALHFFTREIIPNVRGTLRWNKSNNSSNSDMAKGVLKFTSPAIEIRALIEGQMLHRKAVASDMGFNFGESTRILATGGSSINKSILQVMADVFNAPVYVQKTTEAALLGAAYRAKYSLYLSALSALHNNNHTSTNGIATNGASGNDHKSNYSDIPSFSDYISKYLSMHMQRVCDPSNDSKDIYHKMEQRYREMVNILNDSVNA